MSEANGSKTKIKKIKIKKGQTRITACRLPRLSLICIQLLLCLSGRREDIVRVVVRGHADELAYADLI